MQIKKQYLLWIYPLVMLIAQIFPTTAVVVGGLLFLIGAVFMPKLRKSLILFGATFFGYFLWISFAALLKLFGVTGNIAVIAGRFGLLGYLIIFFVWMKIEPAKQNYIHLGKANTIIHFPFIWKGRKEPVWRFVLVFSVMCAILITVLVFSIKISFEIVILGVVFTMVNATMEELLWRGLILPRTVDMVGEKQAVVITAMAFGLYHVSLGFPMWACAVFAVGGFYMGGSAIVSKGLLSPWIMHIAVNFIFVFAGILFS